MKFFKNFFIYNPDIKDFKSYLNFIGLSLGVTCIAIIGAYYLYEQSYDKFIPGSENIYRVSMEQFKDGKLLYHKASSPYAIGPLMKEEIPEVKHFSRCGFERGILVKDKQYFAKQPLFFADTSFFKVFDFELLYGNKEEALAKPWSVVLSEKAAERFFGNSNPLGQSIDVNFNVPCKVTGVFKDLPQNTHLDVELVVSLSTGDVFIRPGWGASNRGWGGYGWIYTYVTLTPDSDPEQVESKLASLVDRNIPEQQKNNGINYRFHLQPLESIHLSSALENEFVPNGSKSKSLVVLFFGLIILIISWVNYINMTIIRLKEKSKTLSIFRINGAPKTMLIKEFLINSFVIHLLCLILGMGLFFISIKGVSSLIQKPLFSFIEDQQVFWVLIGMLPFIGTFVSSIIPVFKLISVKPMRISKHPTMQWNRKIGLHSGLLVAQLSLAVFLIINLLVVTKQLFFVQDKDLGFDRKNIITASIPISLNGDSQKFQKFLRFKNEVNALPAVIATSAMHYKIGEELIRERRIYKLNGEAIDEISVRENNTDEDFYKVIGLDIIAGENFRHGVQQNKNRILITEHTSKLLGFNNPEDAVGQFIHYGTNHVTEHLIIGVLSDYYHENLRESLKPMVFRYGINMGFGNWATRIEPGNTTETLGSIENVWKKNFPDDPFDYHFTDEYISRLYHDDKVYGQIIIGFALISVLLVCIGLLSHIFHSTQSDIKNIGIRKTAGAKSSDILTKYVRRYAGITILSFFLAMPLAFVVAKNWIQNFAYRTSLDWWIFLSAGLIALIISLLTVSWQSWRAATRNPVEALRYE